jgi:hypothetical protein
VTGAQGGSASEADLRAAFVFNFLRYVEWPDDDLETYQVSVLGDSTIIEPLSRAATLKQIHGRSLDVRVINSIDDLGVCHLLYVAPEAHAEADQILRRLQGEHILVVTEGAGMAARGFAVSFVVVDQRVSFEANQQAIRRAGLKASIRLLRSAILVDEAGG